MKSIRQNSLITTSAVLIVTLCIFGWIYSKFPAGWYEPTPIEFSILCTAIIFMTPVIFSVPFPPLGGILLSALLVAMFKHPTKIDSRHLQLLIPVLTFSPLAIWNGYLFSHISKEPGIGINVKDLWVIEAGRDLEIFSLVGIISLFVFVILSKQWKGERSFAIAILTVELIQLLTVIFAVRLLR